MGLPSQVLTAALLLAPVLGYKVLFIPLSVNSHLVLHSSAAEAWVKAGHQAHVVKHHTIPVPTQYTNSGIRYFNHGKEGEVHFSQTEEFEKKIGHDSSKINALTWFYRLLGHMAKICEYVLDEELFMALQKENYDLAVVDHYPVSPVCQHAVAYRLGIPYASLGAILPFGMVNHNLQSSFLIPIMYQSEEPNFLSRFGQFVAAQALQMGMSLYVDRSNYVVEYLKNKSVDDIQEITGRSKIYLVDWEPLLDTPTQSPPNVVHIGGITAPEVKLLQGDLRKFADSAEEGLVVVSFGGSQTADFPDHMQRKLLAGLGMLKYKVIIRLKVKPNYNIGSNILILKWLPQNDLLGHPNTVLFITHCGLSSIRQGVHHGVRMLGVPNTVEQKENAMRIKDRNYGFFMDRNTFTSEELRDNVDKIMADKTIESAMKKAVNIIKSRKLTAAEEVVYWIEHVIKFGGDHIIPYSSKLAWYQVMMYDVLLAILLMTSIALIMTIKCCQGLSRCCYGKSKIKKKTS